MSNYTLEDLTDAGYAMKLASMDYDDNVGSERSDVFWHHFCKKRDEYIKIRDYIKGTSNE